MTSPWEVQFYETEAGRDLILPEIRSLDEKGQAKVAARIDMLEAYGLQLSSNHVRLITGLAPLRELRIDYNRDTFRMLFFPRGRLFIAVDFFRKTTRKTPQSAKDRARVRMQDWLRRYPNEMG